MPSYIPEDKLKPKIALVLKAKHFLPSNYYSIQECPIANAARDHFNLMNITNMLDSVTISGNIYYHRSYTAQMYHNDYKRAKLAKNADNTIRVVMLSIDKKSFIHKPKTKKHAKQRRRPRATGKN